MGCQNARIMTEPVNSSPQLRCSTAEEVSRYLDNLRETDSGVIKRSISLSFCVRKMCSNGEISSKPHDFWIG